MPLGLQNYYEDHWRRLRESDGRSWLDEQLPVLVALTVVMKPSTASNSQRRPTKPGLAERSLLLGSRLARATDLVERLDRHPYGRALLVPYSALAAGCSRASCWRPDASRT